MLVDDRLPVLSARVPDDPAVATASDHLPLVVDVRLPAEDGPLPLVVADAAERDQRH